MIAMPFKKSSIEGVSIIIYKGDVFNGVAFKGCYIDDVSNAPFDNIVFNKCYFEDVVFKSGFDGGERCSVVIHTNSFIE